MSTFPKPRPSPTEGCVLFVYGPHGRRCAGTTCFWCSGAVSYWRVVVSRRAPTVRSGTPLTAGTLYVYHGIYICFYFCCTFLYIPLCAGMRYQSVPRALCFDTEWYIFCGTWCAIHGGRYTVFGTPVCGTFCVIHTPGGVPVMLWSLRGIHAVCGMRHNGMRHAVCCSAGAPPCSSQSDGLQVP